MKACAKRKKKKLPLQWSMLGMLLLGWLLPLTLITTWLLYMVSSTINSQIEKTIHISADKAIEICEIHLDDIVATSKAASYNKTVYESYNENKKGGSRAVLYTEVTNFLNDQYKYNGNLLSAMIFFYDSQKDVYYTYNTYKDENMGTGGYDRVNFFAKYVQPDVLILSLQMDTQTRIYEIDGHVYLIRNLVNNMFRPYGMIILELEPITIFDSLTSIWGALEYEIFLDGKPLLGMEIDESFDLHNLEDYTDKSVYIHTSDYAYVYNVQQEGSQKIAYLVKLDKATIIDALFMVRYALIVVMIFSIPLIFMIVKFFISKVSKPVSKLIAVTTQITQGKYGLEVAGESTSEEFEHLNKSFNSMSKELQYQFEKIYLEELALRDANIKALQSQINPHFLNNTLEIINWEARIKGEENISAMIEALATMLNATLNRKQRSLVSLEEELTYVDAYLYIIGRRFGDRFFVKRNVDEALLRVQIPLLIVQPIVENAVEHGVASNKSGMVELNVYIKEDKVYIEVCNDASLSEVDKEKIAYLLSGEVRDEEEKHISLGIRNVNRRLKIIYGEEYGLDIRGENAKTISTITIPYDYEEQN